MQLYHNTTPLVWLEFPLLSKNPALLHGSYTRLFGTSPKPYDSLNLSSHGSDSISHVEKNKQMIVSHFHERSSQIQTSFPHYVEMNQVHGKELYIIRTIEEKSAPSISHISCDAIATSLPNIILSIKHADCQPIILFDPKKKVIAAIHAGWRGIAQKITTHVISSLMNEWGVNPSDLLAGIGPSIGPSDMEFKSWQKDLPEFLHPYVNTSLSTVDLWKASIDELIGCGVPSDHIDCAYLSTYTLHNLFFSYRRAQDTGRNITAVMLLP